jgi:hypothetical protein
VQSCLRVCNANQDFRYRHSNRRRETRVRRVPLFTSIAPYELQVGAVDVVVGRECGAASSFLCTVTVDLGRSGHVKDASPGDAPSAAIDRAADRTAWLIGRRIGRGFSVKLPLSVRKPAVFARLQVPIAVFPAWLLGLRTSARLTNGVPLALWVCVDTRALPGIAGLNGTPASTLGTRHSLRW